MSRIVGGKNNEGEPYLHLLTQYDGEHVRETWRDEIAPPIQFKTRLAVCYSLRHLFIQLLVVIGGEGGAAVFRDIHPIYNLCHPLPELITLLGGQQPIQDHISILHILSREKKVQKPSLSKFVSCIVQVFSSKCLFSQI